jgi:hypothetical protein
MTCAFERGMRSAERFPWVGHSAFRKRLGLASVELAQVEAVQLALMS